MKWFSKNKQRESKLEDKIWVNKFACCSKSTYVMGEFIDEKHHYGCGTELKSYVQSKGMTEIIFCTKKPVLYHDLIHADRTTRRLDGITESTKIRCRNA